MTDWITAGNDTCTPDGLLQLISEAGVHVREMQTALTRAAWGALNGRAWIAPPAEGEARPNGDEILHSLDMTVTPPGTTAKDAAFRQSLASLLAALDAVDRAVLTAWLAHLTARDPERRA
ncbi:hypothetical protein [Streptomyces anandii]|uniref:hypothetical protein n=1 Tax=Streptomyces anandii TaxID=285454 RepID=UPI003798919B